MGRACAAQSMVRGNIGMVVVADENLYQAISCGLITPTETLNDCMKR